ncbi:MAG: hypothetical protein KDD52_06905 [Bdellovibrionales bacterium]|nr:hypothetical protein [Bdellovibrionales bacterium]
MSKQGLDSLSIRVDSSLRKILLQIDRKKTRKKAMRALERKLLLIDEEHRSPYFLGLAIAHYLSQQYDQCLYYCEKLLSLAPFSIEGLWGSSLRVSIYRTLGMKRERFEAEGKHFMIMKKMALHSQDPGQREMAIEELRKQVDEGDLGKYFVERNQEAESFSSR